MDPDEPLGEAAMSFASKYLNLDYETPTFADHTVEAGTGSPSASSNTTTSPSSTAEDVQMPWVIEPTSLSLLDTTKFEIELDENGLERRNPWPWGDYTYRPPSPPRYLELEEYAQEHRLTKIEEQLRVRLMERFAKEAIRSGKKAKTKRGIVKKKGKGVEKKISTPIVAFSQAIRGRTIYNP
ncbi:hypothetical protein BDM02DRAFT_3120562 [Thelephora ganbajun]|uniref:Uncharacterized protein n=1 Tax=Thelephora ganbajun TaxID=370292 RepID=A0ACB6Z6H4_THEGA|nr:hypothetical protein BDM02DRAFT_3120562 [Thelephora ganbajun]